MSKTVVIAAALAALAICRPNALAQTDTPLPSAESADIVIADFEGDTYGQWKTTGEAFGDGPARANVKPRNRVTGHQGQGLVRSIDRNAHFAPKDKRRSFGRWTPGR